MEQPLEELVTFVQDVSPGDAKFFCLGFRRVHKTDDRNVFQMIVRTQGFRGQLCGRAVNKETVIPDSLRTDVRCVFVELLGIDQFRIGLQQGFLQLCYLLF